MRLLTLAALIGLTAQFTVASELGTLVDSSCLDCHNRSTTEGEVDLTRLGILHPEQEARVLQRMRARVAAGEMPPEEDGAFDPEMRKRFVSLVEDRLSLLAEQLKDDPGDVQMIRLTPYEYRNIMRDLSDGVFKVGGRFLPNEGGAGEGFANVGAAQSLTPAQYEKYVDAALDALKHVRFFPANPGSTADTEWSAFPRPAVDDPAQARKEVIDEIIGWHIAQQQRWGQEHRNALEKQFGFVHPAYLEAAWRYRTRIDADAPIESYAWIAVDPNKPDGERIELAPAALAKWVNILNGDDSDSVHAAWAKAWKRLPNKLNDSSAADSNSPAVIRRRCVAIVAGDPGVVIETEDYAPSYEISFHEAKDEVLAAAENDGHWPFRIDIGDAEELFLVVTDAGDGGRGEYAVWKRGRFIFRDGDTKPWQEVVTIVGANSGKTYPFGFDGENMNSLGPDAVGAKPPGALKFEVPENAIVFEVDLSLDTARTKVASIQALVLKQKPKSQSYVPGRFVFGGKKRPVTAGAQLKKEHERALRKRNIAEANKTKIGLNAERNVFANWSRTTLKEIGGPWPDHEPDKHESAFPYHYTVSEVLRNASNPALAELNRLQNRLESLVRSSGASEEKEIATRTIHDLAERLWRRGVDASEIELLLQLYSQTRVQGVSFDSSLKMPVLGILISPDFLYRGARGSRVIANAPSSSSPGESAPVESPASSTTPLSCEAFASRLSFFLWASLPDAELLRLASDGQLLEPGVAQKQVRRMLKDPRAKSLAIDFGGQLWGYTEFASFDNPDAERFDTFTPQLRKSMQLEVETFLADIFQNDRPLINILDADYTFADDLLAEHYGLKGQAAASERAQALPAESTHRLVKLPPDRGGLPTMGLFLTKTSLPLRTSPVQRGVWLLESLLGRHLPNPPADVPTLSDDDKNAAGESILKQLERHRAETSCATCHDKIDPLGISLENYDPIGRWRDSHVTGEELSNFVTTHDGVALRGAIGLKGYLRSNQDEFIRHFIRKLLGYALGRSVSIGDRFLLEKMSSNLREREYRFSSLIETIVASPQFRTERTSQ